MSEEFGVQNNAKLSADVSAMKSDLSDMKSSINRIADALTKLAILEDRQSGQTTLLEKTLTRLESLEDRQHATELRIATSMIGAERLSSMEAKMLGIANQMAGYEAAGKTASTGIRAFWAVFGGALSSAAIWLIAKGATNA